MYPLNAIIIGRDERLLPHVRRELLNLSAHLEAEFPTAAAALDALRNSRGQKRLVLQHLESTRDIDALAKLSSTFPGWPVVGLMGGGGTADAPQDGVLISAMRAGACQIVSVPLCPKDFKAALDRIALHYVYAVRDTKVIAVAGVTGGCGATTLAINLACEIAHLHQLRCVLVDLSLKMGVIATHLNLQPSSSILDLLRDVRRVDTLLLQRVLIPVMNQCALLPGPDGIAGDMTATPADIAHVLDTLKQITDVIVLDVPCTYDELYFEVIAGAGQAVLIGEQTLPSIRALKLVHDAIGRDPARTDHVVVSRYEPKKKGFTVENLLKPLEVSSLITIARDDEAMGKALGQGCTLRLAAPRSPALSDIGVLTERLLDRNAHPPAKPPGLFVRLGRALTHV